MRPRLRVPLTDSPRAWRRNTRARLPARAVWDAWDLLLTDDRFAAVDEPPGLERQWRSLTEDLAAGRCAETDTYLAAFALAGGCRVLTFDRGLRSFEGVDALVLDSR